MVIEITQAEYVESYKIRFHFRDGKEKTIDFEPFLRNARNPITSQFLDLSKFRMFELEHGDIRWGDYEMCFPIWNLYEGVL
jgi:hypothetical protein